MKQKCDLKFNATIDLCGEKEMPPSSALQSCLDGKFDVKTPP